MISVPDSEDDPASAVAPTEKRWSVGTLTYNSGGLITLFSWLLWGDFAWSMKERSVTPVLQILLKHFEASDTVAGLLVGTLPGVVSILCGPVFSYRSDRHRGPRGRRLPFLLISTPFAVLAMVGLAFSPQLGGWLHRVIGARSHGLYPSILTCLGLFWMIFEVATVAAYSVLGGLINDVVPHAVIGRFYGLFRALSLLAGMIFNFWIIGRAEARFMWIFVGIGILYGGGFMAMCLRVKEGEYPPPPPVEPGVDGWFFRAVWSYLRQCFGHSYYLWVFAANALGWMAFVPSNLFNVFFAKTVGMSMEVYGQYLAVSFGISLGLSYLIGWMADRFHPLRVSLLMLTLYAAVSLWGGLFAFNARSFGLAMAGTTVLSGAWMTATASLGQLLLPKEKFAQFASAMYMVVTIGVAALSPAVGVLLDHTHHTYRYTYLSGFTLAMLSLFVTFVVYRKFLNRGGPAHYLPPDDGG